MVAASQQDWAEFMCTYRSHNSTMSLVKGQERQQTAWSVVYSEGVALTIALYSAMNGTALGSSSSGSSWIC